MTAHEASELPLSGIKIVDLTTVVAGPYATMLLADLGADVVKVEAPGGDPARDLGPSVNAGMGAVFLNFNRGKRSVVLDLRSDEGRRQLKRVTDNADVFVHNMRAATAKRCGADPLTLRKDHPELVHCAIHGFRSTGPYGDLSAYDDIIQAASGIAGQQEWLSDSPTYVGTALADKVSALMAALAITAALHERNTSGRGPVIEVPMNDVVTSFGLLEHLWGRTFVPPRGEARYPRLSNRARRPYQTSNGWISIMVYSDDNWRRFFELLGREELGQEARFATLNARTAHLDELFALVSEAMRSGTTQEWLDRLRAAGIPAGPYHRVDDLFDDEYLGTVGFWDEVEHPSEGTLLQFGTPLVFDGRTLPLSSPAPKLGDDTQAVLEGLDRPSMNRRRS
jgi:crotonobetainyl-CoA:carnitine CoA-transferase CaiB-like acyl-CoA transferase